MLNFIKIDREVFFLAHPLLTRWQAHVCGGCRLSSQAERRSKHSGRAPSCIFLWLHENARVIIKCCLRLGSRATSTSWLLLACFLWRTRYSRMQAEHSTRHVLQCFHPSSHFLIFSSLSLLACHFAGECCLARWAYAQYFWGQMSQALRPHCQQTWGIIRVNKLKAT